jgi:integrase
MGRGARGVWPAPATVAKALQLVHGALESAVSDRMISSNAARYVEALRPGRLEMTFLEPDEVERQASGIDPRYRVLVWFLVLTGVRLGESVALETNDLDCAEPSTCPRPPRKSAGGFWSAHPRLPPAPANHLPRSLVEVWVYTLASARPERVWCLLPPRVVTCAGQPGENNSGSQRSTPFLSRASGSTISSSGMADCCR